MDALTELTRMLERADDAGGTDGAGDLLDDFVVSAAMRVRNLSCCVVVLHTLHGDTGLEAAASAL